MDNHNPYTHTRLTIRVGHAALLFAAADPADPRQVAFEPYVLKSGVSTAANLREAFKTSPLLARGYEKVQLLLDTASLLIPVEEFKEEQKELLLAHTFTLSKGDTVLHSVLPELNAVAVFAMNSDLRTVVGDHFADVRVMPLMQPVWNYLHKRSYTGTHNKLYTYFHDKQLEIFAFQQKRFKFCNAFEVGHARDAIYFMLYVWKQLGLNSQKDELYVAGTPTEHDWLMENLRKYLRKVYEIRPTAEFNRAAVTQIKGMPFDLQTLFTQGTR